VAKSPSEETSDGGCAAQCKFDRVSPGKLNNEAQSCDLVLTFKNQPWHLPQSSTRANYLDVEPMSDYSHTLRATLHILIPASKPGPNLCKAIVLSRVLSYPVPKIINWNQIFNDPAFVKGGSHLAKINGTAQYLNGLDETHDDDLLLMLDGYDAWIQLRPQTVVDRFFDINS
jgi:hypothetical protein